MNVFAKFDEIPSMILEVLLKKQNVTDTWSVGRTDRWTDGCSDNVKTVYPPTNTVCGGYKYQIWELETSEPCCEKTGLRGFQPCPTKTRL